MSKKIFALFTAIIVLSMALAACSPKEEAPAEEAAPAEVESFVEEFSGEEPASAEEPVLAIPAPKAPMSVEEMKLDMVNTIGNLPEAAGLQEFMHLLEGNPELLGVFYQIDYGVGVDLASCGYVEEIIPLLREDQILVFDKGENYDLLTVSPRDTIPGLDAEASAVVFDYQGWEVVRSCSELYTEGQSKEKTEALGYVAESMKLETALSVAGIDDNAPIMVAGFQLPEECASTKYLAGGNGIVVYYEGTVISVSRSDMRMAVDGYSYYEIMPGQQGELILRTAGPCEEIGRPLISASN